MMAKLFKKSQLTWSDPILILLIAWGAGCATTAAPPAAGPAAAPSSECTRAFVFVDRGRPAATIEIPEGAGEAEQRAAVILQSSIRKMSGITLPVRTAAEPGRENVAAVGFPARSLPPEIAPQVPSLRRDGFLIGTSHRNLYIASGGGRGAIYGVVHLLEKFYGCRTYSPTVEVFPRRADLALGCTFEIDNPANAIRIVYGDFALDPDYRDWMRIQIPDEFYGKGYYVHTLGTLVPWQTYFAPHAEYFALASGHRVIDQPCLSRPEVLDIAVSKLREEMAAQPDKPIWSVSQNDNDTYCQCPDCAKAVEEEGSPSGPVIRFVNRVAALFPDKTISTLAYRFSRAAPRLTQPAPNVQVMLCTIELNRSKPIDDDTSSRSFIRDILDWSRISNNLYLWDYVVDFAHYVSPFPNLHVLQPNIRFFVRRGVRQHFQQANTGAGHEFSELKSYLLSRLLWNPDIDFNAAMNEFLDGYYGAAGPFIRRYIDALQAALERSGAALGIYESPVAHADDFLSAPDVAAYNALFDKAEAAVSGDAAVLRRVKTARLPVMYARLEIGMNDLFGPRGFYAERGGRFILKPEMSRLLDDFCAGCLAAGVKTLSEGGLAPGDYYEAAKRAIHFEVEGDLAFRRPVAADPPPSPKYSKGDVAVLTNGVRGGSDYHVHWLGWEGVDFTLTLDLGKPVTAQEISLATLSDAGSWILHPDAIACAVSSDGVSFRDVGTIAVAGDHRGEEFIRPFTWTGPFAGLRAVRFRVQGTKRLPDWHVSAGSPSWVFIDEIVVR